MYLAASVSSVLDHLIRETGFVEVMELASGLLLSNRDFCNAFYFLACSHTGLETYLQRDEVKTDHNVRTITAHLGLTSRAERCSRHLESSSQ